MLRREKEKKGGSCRGLVTEGRLSHSAGLLTQGTSGGLWRDGAGAFLWLVPGEHCDLCSFCECCWAVNRVSTP